MLEIAQVTGRTRSLGPAGRRARLGSYPVDGWIAGTGLTIIVAAAYFLVARLSLGLLMKPDGAAVFWPAAGISSGLLIALGRRARCSVVLGAIIGTIPANLLGDRDVSAAVVFALSNSAEALITAAFVQYCFGAGFGLNSLSHVIGFFAAAAVGPAASGIGGTIGYKLFHSPAAPILTTWFHWFVSGSLGILAVAPVLIGVATAVWESPRHRELVESILVLALLVAMTGLIITLPEKPWQTVAPSALLFPMLLWLAARSRPVFSAIGAFVVSLVIVWTTIFGIGHFGDANLPISDRILQAQAVIFATVLTSLVLAALFSERRDGAELLVRSNIFLKRERDNKLTNAQAMAATIAHELKQPLTAMVANSDAAQRFLKAAPPNLGKAKAALERVANAGCHAGKILDGLRALFGSGPRETEVLSVNEIIRETLSALHREFVKNGVVVHCDLETSLPDVRGHRSQLQEVMANLFTNAIEAMSSVSGRNRLLCVQTKSRGPEAISVNVDDSGPGIGADKVSSIFNAFFTTKRHGMGLGLAISRMIIEQQGGELTMLSNGTCGASFQIVLPAVTAVPPV